MGANVLGTLGATLPDDLIPPNPSNPLGYFESAAILDVRTALEDWAGLSFVVPAAWSGNDWTQRLDEPRAVELRDQASTVFRSYNDRGTSSLVMKDPRTAATLAFWLGVFAEAAVDVEYVVSVREPQAVARSISSFVGLSPAMGLLLWLEAYATIFEFLRNERFLVMHYERWFAGGGQAGALHQALFGVPASSAVLERIDSEIVQPSLNRSGQDELPSSTAYLGLACDLHRWLTTLPVCNEGVEPAAALRTAQDLVTAASQLSHICNPDDRAVLFDFDRRERNWVVKVEALQATIAELESRLACTARS